MRLASTAFLTLFVATVLAGGQSKPTHNGGTFVLKAPAEFRLSHNLLVGLPATIAGTTKQYTAVILVFDVPKLDWLGLKHQPSAVLFDGSEVPAAYVAFRPGWTAAAHGQMPAGIKVSHNVAQGTGGKLVSLTPWFALKLTRNIDFMLDEGPNFLWYLFPFDSVDKVREFRFGRVSLVRAK